MATWSKLFTNFAWKNRPDTSTPLGQTLLNRLNNAINGIDDRVVTLNAEKASTDDVNGLVANISLNEKTGVFTITRFNGTTFTINTALEEVVTNFKYDNSTQQLVLTLADGTTQNVDLSALITQYEFTNSATILWTVTTEGKVVANIKPNSITDQMLQTNYLADITTQANTAVSASQSALESQSLAEQHAEDAEESALRAKGFADKAEAIAGFTIDTTLDANSSNPIANKAVAEALENVNAKKLDGHGAEYFMPARPVTLTTSIKEKARSLPDGTYFYHLSGSSYTGNDLPSQNWYYGSALIVKRNQSSIEVVLFTESGKMAVSAYNGQAWTDWKVFASEADLAKYLPLTGGTVKTSGNTSITNKSTGGDTILNRYEGTSGALGYFGFKGANNPCYGDKGGNVYPLLHTGNKPTGTYTGNGDATQRSIATGSVGNVFMVRQQGTSNFAILTQSGYIAKSGTSIFCGEDAFAQSGNIVLLTASSAFNTSGAVYDYVSL